jgi:hypothetical protein
VSVSTDDLIRAGAGGLAEGILTGGNESRKGVGPATQAILKHYRQDFPNMTYENARNVVRRVQRWITAGNRVSDNRTQAVPARRLPINPALSNETQFRFQYKVAVQFTSQGGRRQYRTVTNVNSNRVLSLDEIQALAEQHVREDRGYNARTGKSTRPAIELKNYSVSDFSLISATRRD